MASFCEKAPIVKKASIAAGIGDLVVYAPRAAAEAQPGQFVHIALPNFSLRRPISFAGIEREKGQLRLIIEARGRGTEQLLAMDVGDELDMMGPLGHGFALLEKDQKAVLVAGGIGTPPMLPLAAYYGANATAIIGFRDASRVILTEDFAGTGTAVQLATDDGSAGEKGFVTDLLRRHLQKEKPAILYACGPKGMLKIVADIAKEEGVRCQLSLEERMGCGVGACLVCACKVHREQGDTYAHVCKDGPVFEAQEVAFDE